MNSILQPPELDERTFNRLAELVYHQAGIKLGPHKHALVSARVSKRMKDLGIQDFRHYYRYVSEDASGEEIVELLNVISTNVTSFFREPHHFEFLTPVVRRWEEAGQTRFRVWSAASSTGEEPYSIAIMLSEALRDTRDVRILATDISTRALHIAQNGLYEPRHMEQVPKSVRLRYFTRQASGDDARYQVSDAIRKMITFTRMNLATPPFPMRGPFDLVFCRNVMIYFDDAVRRRLLAELYRLTKPGGYLLVGHAESLSGMLSSFRNVEPSIFLRPERS